MLKSFVWRRRERLAVGLLGFVVIGLAETSAADRDERRAFVIVERTATIGPEATQEEYAKLARDILPKYGGHYLARSRNNVLLEGEGDTPCCVAILEFPDMEAARRWYGSPENQAATKVRNGGAQFRLIAVEGLPAQR